MSQPGGDHRGRYLATMNEHPACVSSIVQPHPLDLQLIAAFGTYVHPALAARLLEQGDDVFTGERREVTAMFGDISDFTPFAEANNAEATVAPHESGNVTLVHSPLAVLAALFHRLGHLEAAATTAGFAFNPLTAGWFPEISAAITDLRRVLGDQAYESLARKGEAMTTAAIVTYAYDQIDQARTELEAVSK